MGIIKKMKQLGEQIRGAKVGYVATFDKDGHVIATDKLASKYLLPAILTTDNGKFLRVKPAGGSAEWAEISQVPAFTQDDDGKVLTATGSGAAWVLPQEDVTDQFSTTGSPLTLLYMKAIKIGNIIFLSYRGRNNTESAISAPLALTYTGNVAFDQGIPAFSSVTATLGLINSSNGEISFLISVSASNTVYINGCLMIT